ncbi:MAG TPA: flagellar hook-basal body complex protein [Tepidisphaeraceae bacterium]|jgi:flagellar hook protein FlgE|nr:flagellar hook-basal body complex protein [Tepidisphaeraceae bacterium]
MALTSTLFTGLSGLDVNQTRMNVVGNNIANVNTVAFKSSRALFAPQFYVTDQGGSPPDGTFGGTNPSQRGLGATVASIEKNFTPGALETTGHATDMAIDGTGFFVTKDPDGQFYTRDGSFTLNSANQLVTSSGAFVQGYGVDANANVIPGQLQNITIPLGTSTIARATQNVSMQGNLDAAGQLPNGVSILTSQDLTTIGGAAAPTGATLLTQLASTATPGTASMNVGDVFTLTGDKGGRTLPSSTFTVTPTSTVNDLTTFYQQGLGIDTGVPASTNPNIPAPGATLEADAANPNSAKLVITGNQGNDNALAMTGSAFVSQTGSLPFVFSDGTNAAGIKSNPSGESVHTSLVAYDSLGTPINVDITANLESKGSTGNVWRFTATSGDSKQGGQVVGDGTLTFDGNGALQASSGTTIAIDRTGTGSATPLSIKMDFSKMTELTGDSSSLVMTKQDGSPLGTLNSFNVGADGTITGAYSNGLTRTLGQVAIANFANPQGLDDKGGNVFAQGANSGVAVISSAMSLGNGAVRAGTLELSNVDLSTEFTNMIIASTGFSASSRVISTSNQLIQDLLNSAR